MRRGEERIPLRLNEDFLSRPFDAPRMPWGDISILSILTLPIPCTVLYCLTCKKRIDESQRESANIEYGLSESPVS